MQGSLEAAQAAVDVKDEARVARQLALRLILSGMMKLREMMMEDRP